MAGLAALARFGRGIVAAIVDGWFRFWFQSRSTTPLEVARIGIGAALLLHYAMATPYLFEVWGDAGWMPLSAALENLEDDPWRQSVFFHFTAPWQWIAFHALFLLCCAAFTVGWRTSWVKWIVLVGQISYDYRNTTVTYGVDIILACLLVILCAAPIGRDMSLDRARAVRAAKRDDLQLMVPQFSSSWVGACTRLMQIQMAVLFLYSGLGKRGDDWWSGDAIWSVATTNEFYNPAAVGLLAHQYWLVNLATYMTILIEIAYPFLIWQRRTRPYELAAAVSLHVLFATFMGLIYFSFVMIMGHMSFVRPEWLQRLGAWWKRRIGDIEIIYDSRSSHGLRSAAWLLSFDGLQQIALREIQTIPRPAGIDGRPDSGPRIVLPDGRTLAGFDAYRHIVPRVPGLWWLVPLFHVPVVSPLLGRPIYDWVAASRRWLSTAGLPPLPRAKL
jgi:hypothetical protein